MKYIFFLFLISTVLISCKKHENHTPSTPPPAEEEPTEEPVYDTVFPSSYFPAWPGSFWTYENTNGEVRTDSVSPYQLRGFELYGETFHSKYYPVFKNKLVEKYVLHSSLTYSAHNDNFSSLLPAEPFVTGSSFVRIRSYPGIYEMNQVLAGDSTVTVNGVQYDHVAVINLTRYQSMTAGFNVPFPAQSSYISSREYYAKDVGLIKREKMNVQSEIYYTENLTDYFINY